MKTIQQFARHFIKHNKKIVLRSNIPVKIIPGSSQEPTIVGDCCHYTTKNGTRIVYPASYSVKGYSNMVYIKSTQCIEIGENFCCNI